MKKLALCCVLVLAHLAHAEVKITGETTVQPNRLVRLVAEGVDAKAGIVWRVYPPFKVDKASAPKGKLEFVAPPGIYEVTLLAVKLSATGETQIDEATTQVTIGEPVPPPPPPPPPDDALTKALRTALEGVSEPDKAASVKKLASLYRMAAEESFLSKHTTWGPLFKAMVEARQATVGEKILKVREAIQTELASTLPKESDKPLDAVGRALAAATFLKVSRSLEAL